MADEQGSRPGPRGPTARDASCAPVHIGSRRSAIHAIAQPACSRVRRGRRPGYSRPAVRGPPRPPCSDRCRPPPERSRSTPARDPEPPTSWSRVRAQLRRTVDDASTTLWLAPLRPAALDGEPLVLAARRRRSARGSPTASAGDLRRAPRPTCWATASRSSSCRREAAAAGPRRAPMSRRPGRRPTDASAQPEAHLRPVRHRRRQPLRPRRRARRRRAARRRPTTRCSSTARPASARPTCCTRSATTCAVRRAA